MKKMLSILVVMMLSISGILIGGNVAEEERDEILSGPLEGTRGIPHPIIRIDSNADFISQATAEGWSGNGTESNPYIIENYDIDAEGAGNAIYIGNTTAYFIIRGCELYNTSYQSSPYERGSGITLYNVENGRVENNVLRDNPDYEGAYIEQSSYITIYNNTVDWNYHGITLYYSSNCSIMENNITNSTYYGIYLWNAVDNTVENNTVMGNGAYGHGVYLDSYSNRNVVQNNTLKDNDGTGVYIYGYSSDNLIRNNTIYRNRNGIYVYASSINNTIELNHIENIGYTGIYIGDSSNNNYISSNFINDTFTQGVEIFSSTNNTVTSNTIMNVINYGVIQISWDSYDTEISNNYLESNGPPSIFIDESSHRAKILWNIVTDGDSEGIIVSKSNYATVMGNFLSGNGGTIYSGMKLSNSVGSTLENNEVYFSSDCGMQILSCSNLSISYNILEDNQYGIYLDGTSNTTIFNNSIYSNTKDGLSLVSNSLNNSMYNNTITGNLECGIRLDLSNSSFIHNNTVQANGQYGIYLNNANFSRIYANDFIDNGIQAYDNGTNYWNLTYPGGGNYWSDYSGIDIYSGPGQNLSGSDGFGDTPYTISGGSNLDHYPLMGMEINLGTGWNLISLPWQNSLISIENALAGISWDRAMVYWDGEWHTYNKARPAKYNLGFPEVDNTVGIWVNVTANSTLCGPSRDIGSTDIWLLKGWNLVGYPSENDTKTVAEALSGVPYLYVQTANETGAIITLADTDIMTPGKGYWIYVTTECVWTVEW